MRPVTIVRTFAAADTDGISDGVSADTAGQALSLNGALVSGGIADLGEQRKVTIVSTLNLSGMSFTINRPRRIASSHSSCRMW